MRASAISSPPRRFAADGSWLVPVLFFDKDILPILQVKCNDCHGAKPKATNTVKVNYHGWLDNGKVFDSSYKRGEPISFPLNRVIKGWTEGVQLMVEGEKTRFWIPEKIAYGGKQPPFGMLVFDVELIDFK